jgi:hypothetical protein
VSRFILNGEGRIDHISGYLDGFGIWKDIHESGKVGIIRGDESFGWHPAYSEEEVIETIGIKWLSEIQNIGDFKISMKSKQELPEDLNRNPNESLSQWRDRLYHLYRLQNIIAPLGDLKLNYVEQINPLLSKRILQTVYSLPDHLRTKKVLWKKIIESFKPQVPFASRESIASAASIMESEKFYIFLKSELGKDDQTLFDQHLIKKVEEKLKFTNRSINNKEKKTIRKMVKSFIPVSLYQKLKKIRSKKKDLNYNQLAFRIILIKRVYQILNNK